MAKRIVILFVISRRWWGANGRKEARALQRLQAHPRHNLRRVLLYLLPQRHAEIHRRILDLSHPLFQEGLVPSGLQLPLPLAPWRVTRGENLEKEKPTKIPSMVWATIENVRV